MSPPRHDLFLSYRWSDAAAVEPLLAALRARNITVWQDAHEVEDTASIQQAVSTGLAGARALLVWYSARYNASRACQWELTSAYTAAQAEGDPRLRILVVNPESDNAHIHLPELFDQLHLSGAGVPGDAAALDRLAQRIEAALRRTPATALGALCALTPPLWLPSMGTGSNRFVGRMREMWRLHGCLQAGQAAMLTGTGGKSGLTLVNGAGGIGKSLMAEEYALRFGAAYPGGVYWLRAFGYPDGGQELDAAQRSIRREAQMIDIAAGLGLDTSGLNTAQVRGALAAHFQRQAQPFLWVVDDLPPDPGPEGLGGWQAPHPLGRTLVTTRTRRFSHVTAIELPQLEPDDARRLLTRHHSSLSPAETVTADAICTLLGCHALAVDVTAALVKRRGLTQVLDNLQQPGRDALALAAQLDEALPNGHQRPIAATFLASIAQLDEPARDLLRHAAVLAVAPIPRQLLVDCAATENADKTDAQDQVDLAADQLLASCLADEAGEGTISVHTLVSRTLRFAESSPQTLAPLRQRLTAALTTRMVDAQDIRQHASLSHWVTHARELSKSPADPATAALLGWVARFDLERGDYPLAKVGFEQEYEARKRLLGEEHPATLTSMSNLASTLWNQGDLTGARALGEAVLAAQKRLLGEEHPDTLTSMNNLASTLRAQGDLPGARELQEAVLAARKHLLGEEHPDTLTSMNNLATVLHTQGDLPGARELGEAVLTAHKRLLGEEHPTTLTSMSNLAETLRAQGDLPGAQELQAAVLAARKRLLGEEHPDTLTSMHNLASTLWRQDEKAVAQRLQAAAATGLERTLGTEHPYTATALASLARMETAFQ